jgi:drug/metabolite transporter (DMT)-like permease
MLLIWFSLMRLTKKLRSLMDASLFAVPGAIAQAAINVARGYLRAAMLETGGVDAWQSIWAALFVAFAVTGLLCLVFRRFQSRGTWSSPPRSASAWHLLRFLVGFSATFLIVGSAQEGFASKTPVAMITVLSSTGALWVALNDLRRFSRTDGAGLVLAQLALTGIGFGGIIVATWQSVANVNSFNASIFAAVLAGFLLGCLQLIQSRLVKTLHQDPIDSVTVYSLQAIVVSGIGLGISTANTGVWPHMSLNLICAALALGLCFAACQVFLQLANGFGSPSTVGVLVYVSIPSAYIFDYVLFHKTPNPNQMMGSCLILVAAIGINVIRPFVSKQRSV